MSPAPRTLWYVTIDDRADEDHRLNVEGLTAAANAWGRGLRVERRWLGDMPTLTADDLPGEDVFALFLAGSFPEWVQARDDAAWAQLLDHLASLVRETTVPVLAVCGSHQAVARAFASWEAVGHMVAAGSAPARVSAELVLPSPDNLIPDPRLGEEGTYPLRLLESDPLFAGIDGDLVHVTETHCDEVLDDARSRLFTAIAAPAPELEAAERDRLDPPARCQVQALRYDGGGRVLYTLQFHPELEAHPVFYQPEYAELLARSRAMGNDGMRILQNFFDIAEASWAALSGDD